MPNEHYEPDATEDAVIDVVREEGRVNAPLVVAETDLERAAVNHALRNLATAGWCRKVARGLYEYVADPRVGEDGERSERASTLPESGAVSRARDALATWDPENVDNAKARRATVAAVAYLSACDARQQKTAILAALDERDATEGYSESTLWEKVVQPGLRELVEREIVTHGRGSGYAIVEEEAGD